MNYPTNLEEISSLSTIRMQSAQNWTLALLYEELNMPSFVKLKKNAIKKPLDFKDKGDVMESFIGELHKFISLGPSALPDNKKILIPIAKDVLQKIVSHALYRGQFLRSLDEIKRIQADAEKPGGGGLLQSKNDVKAVCQIEVNSTIDASYVEELEAGAEPSEAIPIKQTTVDDKISGVLVSQDEICKVVEVIAELKVDSQITAEVIVESEDKVAVIADAPVTAGDGKLVGAEDLVLVDLASPKEVPEAVEITPEVPIGPPAWIAEAVDYWIAESER